MAGDLKNTIDSTTALFLNELFAPLKDDNGVALPSRYEVLFLPPSGINGGQSNNIFTDIFRNTIGRGELRRVAAQCNKIEFPALNLDTTEDTNIYGPARSIVNGFSYGEVTGNFYMSEAYKEKQFFEEWQKQAYNDQNFTLGYYDDYVGEIQIYSLDRSGARRYGVKLWECFPKVIAASNLDAQPATTPQTVDVTFAYRYWQNITEDGFIANPINTARRLIGNTVERELLRNIPKVLRKL